LRGTVATSLAGLGVPPHIIEAILNHKSGTVSGVAGIYNRHDYAAEKRAALQLWADHVAQIVNGDAPQNRDRVSRLVVASNTSLTG